jgi:ferrous iron transport protein B
LHCWHRLRRFILNAGKLIVPVCLVIGIANNITLQGQWLTEPSEHSALSVVGQKIVPIFKPLGIEENNWPAAVGLFTGILAKEVVIGTLNSLYTQQQPQAESFSFKQSMQKAVHSIGHNFKELAQDWRNPIAASGDNPEMSHHAYGEMVKRFNGQANVFAYLLFVLLYFPCISATAAMVREVQKGWTLFSVCWTTGLAYAMAVIYYQCATFIMHPIQSSVWLIIWIGIGIFTFWGIRYYSRYFLPKVLPTPIVLRPS